MKNIYKRGVFFISTFLVVICFAHANTIRYVMLNPMGTADGSSWNNASNDIQAMINISSAGDTIWIAQGVYKPNRRVDNPNVISLNDRYNTFLLKTGVALVGGFNGTEQNSNQRNWKTDSVILSGDIGAMGDTSDNCIHVLTSLAQSSVLLDGLYVTNGNANMNNVLFPVNQNFSIFQGYGGGLYDADKQTRTPLSSITVNNCQFFQNYSFYGSAIYSSIIALNINNSVFENNYSYGSGGAIVSESCTGNINRTAFYKNTSISSGGAIYFRNSITVQTISSSLFAYNSCTGSNYLSTGGAIYFDRSDFADNIFNCDFVGNTTQISNGGAIAAPATSNTINISNSILWNNTADVNGNPIFVYNNLSTINVNYSIVQGGYNGTSNLKTDPLFKNIANPLGNDGIWRTSDDGLVLTSTSPAINSGDPKTNTLNYLVQVGNLDFAGINRIIGTSIDIGSYEYNTGEVPVTIIDFTGTIINGIAQLEWNTGIENNFDHFEVEKSVDGVNFEKIGAIKSKGMNSSYKFETIQNERKVYYRLKTVDTDGSYSYFNKIILLYNNDKKNETLYPNPAVSYFRIYIDKGGVLSIYDGGGRLIKNVPVLNTGINTIDIHDLIDGIYYIQVNNTKAVLIKRTS